jgi:AmiR/NasT family two-component response regulator
MMTLSQRKQFLLEHHAPQGMALIAADEINGVTRQLITQQVALASIAQILGPYTLAAKGNPVDAAGRCFNAAEALRKRVAELEQELAKRPPLPKPAA